MPKKIELKVHLAFDEEARVWYVAHSDIPGLSLEAATASALVERVEACAAEMIDLNLAKIIEANDPVPAAKAPRHRKRQGMTWLPVFDSPMELAHA